MTITKKEKMRYINLSQTEKIDKIVDNKRLFRLFYVPELNEYFMGLLVPWIAQYERYYRITKSDCELYTADKESFYAEFADELSQKADVCFSERFVGAAAVRDYDGAPRFQDAYPLPDGAVNPFQGYGYADGIFYARVVWKDNEIFVPPLQIIKHGDEIRYPLREKCELQTDKNGQPICYKLKRDEAAPSILADRDNNEK